MSLNLLTEYILVLLKNRMESHPGGVMVKFTCQFGSIHTQLAHRWRWGADFPLTVLYPMPFGCSTLSGMGFAFSHSTQLRGTCIHSPSGPIHSFSLAWTKTSHSLLPWGWGQGDSQHSSCSFQGNLSTDSLSSSILTMLEPSSGGYK